MFTVRKLLLILIAFSLTAGSFFAATATSVSANERAAGMISDAAGRTASTMAKNDPTDAARAEDRAKKEAAANEECGFFNIGYCLHQGIAVVMEAMLSIFAYFVGLAGTLLETTIDITILKLYLVMNPSESGLPSPIYVAWTLFRDIANILLIFALLTIGIATILDISHYGAKQLLPKVLIVAVLLNFSIFFCKAAVDVTNIFTLSFYDAITSSYTVKETKKEDEVFTMGLGALIMDHLKLSSIYNTSAKRANDTTADQKASKDSPLIRRDLSTGSVILIGIAGSILFTIIAFIFFAASLSLIARFVILIFLTALAPLAFVSYILPRTQGMWDQWLETYIKHLLFAPLYMMLLWAALQIVPRLSNLYTGQAGDFAILATKPSAAGLIIFNFILMCGFFMGALLIAKKAGAYGADTSLKGLKSVGRGAMRYGIGFGAGGAAALYRNTRGRLAQNYLNDSTKMQALDKKASRGWVTGSFARAKKARLAAAASSSGDIRNTKLVKKLDNKIGGLIGEGSEVGGFKEYQEAAAKKYAKAANEYASQEDLIKRHKALLNEKVLDPKGLTVKLSDSESGSAYLAAYTKLSKNNKALQEATEAYNEVKDSKDASMNALKQERLAALNTATNNKTQAETELQATKDKLSKAQLAHVTTLEDLQSRADQGGDRGVYIKSMTQIPFAELFTGMSKDTREEVRKKVTKPKSPDDKANESFAKLLDKMLKERDKKPA